MIKQVLAFDVGGTKISYALVNSNGNFASDIYKIATPDNVNSMESFFTETIQRFEEEICAVAFATAGAVNLANNKVESSTPNLPHGYRGINFESLSKHHVYVENDANAAAYAEYKMGAAQGIDNNITVTLGTGIGGGIITNGKLLRGHTGRAAEIGSIKLYPDKRRRCNCGNYDCFEAYASGTGLRKTFIEMARLYPDEMFLINKNIDELTTYDLFDGYINQDAFCMSVVETWHNHLFAGLLSLQNIFDTEMFVISGGIGEYVECKKLEDMINKETVVSPVKVVHAKMNNNCGMIGAALGCLNKFYPEIIM